MLDVTTASSSTSPAIKRIQNDGDVIAWQATQAYSTLVLFLARLCESAVGKQTRVMSKGKAKLEDRPESGLDGIISLLEELQLWTVEIEPLKTPQRFGNLAFRTWGERLEEKIDKLHKKLLPSRFHPFIGELKEYLLGAFGSWIRLDYGSGHELSFLAWLCFLTTLGALSSAEEHQPQMEERLAVEVIPKYLEVVWTLQDRYGLEPAGSHGVWGLDDYQFIPYAIGAAQLRNQCDYLPSSTASSSHKPDPFKLPIKDLLLFEPRASARTLPSTAGPPFANLYTTSIARIHALKRGPFSEHSPILYDVATTVPNWIKVHSGMMKMWEAECLGKRPVVQHFPFGGSCFVWEGAKRSEDTQYTSNDAQRPIPRTAMAPTPAPWKANNSIMPPTAAPWASTPAATPLKTGASRAMPLLASSTGSQVFAKNSMADTGSAAATSSPFGVIPRPSVPTRNRKE